MRQEREQLAQIIRECISTRTGIYRGTSDGGLAVEVGREVVTPARGIMDAHDVFILSMCITIRQPRDIWEKEHVSGRCRAGYANRAGWERRHKNRNRDVVRALEHMRMLREQQLARL